MYSDTKKEQAIMWRDHAKVTVERIYETMAKLINLSKEQGISTAHAADVLAE